VSAAALTALWPTRAAADDGPGFTLDWQSYPACDGSRVRPAVERLLGSARQQTAAPLLHARAQLSGTAQGYSLVIDVVQDTTHSSRRLEVASCDEAVGTTALVLALAIDPDIASRVPADSLPATARFNEPAHPRVAPTPPPSFSQPPPSPAGARARYAADTRQRSLSSDAHKVNAHSRGSAPASPWPLSGFMATTGALSFGTLPAVAPGLALAGGVNVGALRLAALGSQYLERTAQSQDTSGSLTVDLGTIDLRAGWRLGPEARWQLVPTASVEFGRFSGEGHGVDSTKTPRFAWGAAGVGAALELRLAGAWLVLGEADALVPFRRTEFLLNHTAVHRPAPVAGTARLGIAYELGKRP
jgi:hypothetical protein